LVELKEFNVRFKGEIKKVWGLIWERDKLKETWLYIVSNDSCFGHSIFDKFNLIFFFIFSKLAMQQLFLVLENLPKMLVNDFNKVVCILNELNFFELTSLMWIK
jgi:hypothetical protein